MKYPKLSLTRNTILLSLLFTSILAIALLVFIPRRSSAAGEAREPDTNAPAITIGGAYRQTNLVSDLPGIALIEDRLLRNPWGVAVGPGSPFWVVNNKSDSASIYKGDVGEPLAPNAALPSVGIVNVPTFAPAPSLPTGVVANNTNDFQIRPTLTDPPVRAEFLFCTLNGAINAWEPRFGSAAVVVQFMSGHSYTGLTIGVDNGISLLYAVDFANGKIDVFDKDFQPTSVSGNFADASIPTKFHPFNVQNLNGSLYVTYAQFERALNFDLGFVRKFDAKGVRDTGFAINNSPLVDPWGLALAPSNFGAFSNALLVGNSRPLGIHDPTINAFNPATGALLGNMVDESGAALEIDHLKGLTFGNGVNGGDPNTLYFTANIFSEFNHGLVGSLKPASPAVSQLQFSTSDYFTTEGAGHFDVTVRRAGTLTTTATVNYATVDSSASQKSNYEIALGTLTFSPGEISKTFRVLIVDDHILGAGTTHDLNLVLSNATGAALVSPTMAKLFIMDDEFDSQPPPLNIIDDPQFFVRQQYFDFLNREPDTEGFNFWVNQITSCETDQQCIELRRINVSAAFFLSIEFQRTGMLAYLTEKAAFGGFPRYGPFMRDVQALQKNYVFGAPGAAAQLESNKQAFFDEFVQRPAFVAKYGALSNSEYVFALFASGQINTTTAELYIAQLNGNQVVPSSGSPAAGLIFVRQAINQPKVSVSLYTSGLSSAETQAHIHGPSPADANGPVIANLPNGQVLDFETPLTNAQLLDLSRGLLYVDVHTLAFPNGEIRAQLPRNLFVTDMIIRSLDAGIITRAQALRLTAESDFFRTNELNRAFVLMEYFGYLRRNPDDPPDNNLNGYNFWLTKLNQFNGNFVQADMVKAFIKSSEYRHRFGP